MTANPVTILLDTPLINAYRVMDDRGLNRLPVLGQDGTLTGIITRSDIQQVIPFFQSDSERVDALFSLAGMTVQEIMTRNPVTVAPDDPIHLAAKQMIARKISGLPVVEAGRVVGIITESDIFRLVVDSWSDDD